MSEEKISYLTSDEPIHNQKFVCLSIVTPEIVKNCNVRAIKIRGVYASEEEAKNRCRELNKIDPDFNIYIAPVGSWVPWCDDPDKAEDCEYSNDELNKLMKAYKENQVKAKMLHENRKQELIEKNIRESEENKKKLENQNNNEEESKDLETIEENNVENNDLEIKDSIKPEEIEKIEEQLNKQKDELDDEKKNLDETNQKISENNDMKKHIQEELKRAKELYDKLN